MSVYIFIIGLIQCFFLWHLGKNGLKSREQARRDIDQAKLTPSGQLPNCALIVPVAGENPFMETALRSLLEQEYPHYKTCLVLATEDDPAARLIRRLEDQYIDAKCVIAGLAKDCGQKNFSLLAGIESCGSNVDVYVFCDANHEAHPLFLRCLVDPLARGEAAFATGYHVADPQDQKIVSLGYSLSILFMGLMQALPGLTQPWGGALAIRSEAFRRYGVADTWRTNVVDDCSLAALLKKERLRIQYCPAAILRTPVVCHALSVWRAWLARQILFLKFCMPDQWIGLSAICFAMFAPPLWCCAVCIAGIVGIGSGSAPFLALCWFFCFAWSLDSWRPLLPGKVDLFRWILAFFGSSATFALAYTDSLFTRKLFWRNFVYTVGKGGVVEQIKRV